MNGPTNDEISEWPEKRSNASYGYCLARLLRSFEIALEAAGLSPATLRIYAFGVRKLFAFLDRMGLDAPLSGVSAEHLREWLNYERKSGAAPATVEALHKAARAFWRFLMEEGEISENVTARLPAPKVPERVFKVLSAEETDKLFASLRRDRSLLGIRDEAALALLLTTGLRLSEAVAVEMRDIDLRERRLLVRGAKGGRERILGLEPAALRLLSRYWRRAGIDAGAILRDRSGRPLSAPALYLMIRRRTKATGIEQVTPHTFRRTCASRLLAQGVSENAVRVMMGWSRKSAMLSRYVAASAAEQALAERARVSVLG